MASVNYRNKRAEIRFYDHRGTRRTVALGAIPTRAAESAAKHIQGLVNSKIGGLQPYPENVEWACNQKPRVVDYLSGLGLIQPRQVDAIAIEPQSELAPTLDEWFSRYIDNRQGSAATKLVWNRAKNQAVKFFGKNRRIDTITLGDAINWFERMQNGDSKGKGKLAVATARKMLGVTRQVFSRARKFKHIDENPFVDKELATTIGHRNKPYVELSTIQSLLKVLPSAEWRAIIIFARIAGLRVQSELPLLKWSDINWEQNRFLVTCPKKKNTRLVPIFPEIREILDELRPITGQTDFVLSGHKKKSKNWRTPLQKLIVRAGIEPWKPLYNSLRSSAARDISRKHGMKCETEWLGHSVKIAMENYEIVTDTDFGEAANQVSSFAPKVAPELACNEGNGAELLPRLLPTSSPEMPAKRCNPNKKRASGEISLAREVDDIGPETNAVSPFESTNYEEHRCQRVTAAPEDAPNYVDCRLQSIINAWPMLTETTRVMVERLVFKAP